MCPRWVLFPASHALSRGAREDRAEAHHFSDIQIKRRCSVKMLRLHEVALAATLLLACPLVASAQKAGYDLLQTQSGASIDLSSLPGFSPSKVPLKGVPICACTGGTDTIMYRTQAVPPGGGNVPLSVIALFLKNSD